MGSRSEKMGLLEYLRSRSQVDCDCLDTQSELLLTIKTVSTDYRPRLRRGAESEE